MATSQTRAMKDLQGYFKESELLSFFGSLVSLRDRTLFRLLYKSGRRVSEVLSLKVKDIDWELSMINYHILKKKAKDYHAMKPIDNKTLALLSDYCHESEFEEDSYLFPKLKNRRLNNLGKPTVKPCEHMTRQAVWQIMQRQFKKLGIEKVGNKKPHPHHFRHTFAIRMAQKMKTPADIRKLQMLLEHSNLGQTETYLQK